MTQFGNDLLDMLSEDDRDALSPLLEEVHLRTGYIIAEPGNIIRFSYFPRNESLVAYLIPMPDGETVECSMIGREGAVGSIVSRSALPAYARCCVHHGGDFFRIPVNALEGARARSPGLNNLLSRQADCLIAQLFQSIACNARHSIEQRTARWLCAAMSHIGSKEVPLTQAQLGGFLGVGRSYLTRVLARFREKGILGTRRGAIIIHQPRKLRSMACDCNALIDDHFKTVIGGH